MSLPPLPVLKHNTTTSGNMYQLNMANKTKTQATSLTVSSFGFDTNSEFVHIFRDFWDKYWCSKAFPSAPCKPTTT